MLHDNDSDPVFQRIVGALIRLSLSVSLPRIWLSRGTSKTQALGDDTAAYDGVAYGDHAWGDGHWHHWCLRHPSLHFVEPGLKINGDEWIKVMDEYHVPNCAALMEPGRKFLLILDNAPSHASRLACEHYKTLVQGTVEFQPPCSPDLSPLDYFLRNELKVQLDEHPAPANPAELRALLTRVYHRT